MTNRSVMPESELHLLQGLKGADSIIRRMVPFLTIDLAPKNWQRIARALEYVRPGFGCCYPASEVLYYIWGRDAGFRPWFLRTGGVGRGHWFLRDSDGSVVDPTACQFDELPNYNAGHPQNFLTRGLSKRARILFARMGKKGEKLCSTSN
jgi:hypothetical protein